MGAEERLVALQDAVARVGCSYRQAHYWQTQGYVRVRFLVTDREVGGGSGSRAYVTPGELEVLGYMQRLTRAGIVPQRAALLARRMAEGLDSLVLGEGFVIGVGASEEPWPVPDWLPGECGARFPSQEVCCSLERGHGGAHRRGGLAWTDDGRWAHV